MLKVAASVSVKDGKILAARRKAERIGGGYWEFPGGKVEANETPKQACQREVLEELGDEAEILERLKVKRHYQTPYGSLEIDFFWTRLKTFNLKHVAASEYSWLTKEELWNVAWLEASKSAVSLIAQTNLEKYDE